MKIGSTAALNSATFCWYTNAGNVEVAGKRLKGETTMTGTKFAYALHKRTVAYAMGVY